MSTAPAWLLPGARVWFHELDYVVGDVDARGVVLEVHRRGRKPFRQRLNTTELADALRGGVLRPLRPEPSAS